VNFKIDIVDRSYGQHLKDIILKKISVNNSFFSYNDKDNLTKLNFTILIIFLFFENSATK
jgi:hypothetical protein